MSSAHADPHRRAALLQRLAEEGGFENEEVEFRRRDGSTFWGLANAVVIRDPRTGRSLYHVGSITDITERKQAADAVRALNATLEERVVERTAALQASEARFRTLVEHAPEAIVVFDGETGRFLDANEKVLKLYGISRERLLECGPADVIIIRRATGSTAPSPAKRPSSSGCTAAPTARSSPARCGWSVCPTPAAASCAAASPTTPSAAAASASSRRPSRSPRRCTPPRISAACSAACMSL
ncbi:MAG: PAS domain S-box protein [Verrucomicrobiales bacterium]|nr:PAS domain S-box protein [Verrucomicrobiales bacterium]